jgi:hypothetical protein
MSGSKTVRRYALVKPPDDAAGTSIGIVTENGKTGEVAMRMHALVPMLVGLVVSSCDDSGPAGPTPAAEISITTVTSGLDIDADGYRLIVNSVDEGTIAANGTLDLTLEPGEQTIGLAALAPNCAVEDAPTRTVTVGGGETVPLELQVVCTAASGVVGIGIEATGVDMQGEYAAMIGGVRHRLGLDGPTYLQNVAPGAHVISLVTPGNCSVQTEHQSVLVAAGTLVRDTAEVTFAVSCSERPGNLRITTITSGTPSPNGYTVHACYLGDFYCDFYGYDLGAVDPIGELVTEIPPGSYEIWLEGIPVTCSLVGPTSFTARPGDKVDLTYVVSCP